MLAPKMVSSNESIMQQKSDAVILRFRARLCLKSASIRSESFRPYCWVKDTSSGLSLVAKKEYFNDGASTEEQNREFRIEVHTADETIAVYETKSRGGFGGCVFARSRAPSATQRNQHIKPSDVYSGSVLSLAGRMFEVLEADAFTMRYVRANPLLFSQRAVPTVLRAIIDAQLLEPLAYAFCQLDLASCGFIKTSEFLQVMNTIAANATVLQDRIALAQEFVVETDGTSSDLKISYTSFLAALQAAARGECLVQSSSHPSPTPSPSDFTSMPTVAMNLQMQLRRQLLSKGLHSAHRFLGALLEASRSSYGLLDNLSLQQSLFAVGIRDMSLPTVNHIISSFSDGRSSIHDVLSSVQRHFNAGQRAEICRRIFRSLDRKTNGVITTQELVGRFDSTAACQMLRGQLSSTELRAQWIAAFDGQSSPVGVISQENFLDAMCELSWAFVDDGHFAAFAAKCLGAEQISRRCTSEKDK